LIDAIEVAFESIYASGPELPELSQPRIDLPKWFRFQPVETTLCVHGAFHEAGVSQHSKVLRHGRLRHLKLMFDLSDRLFRRGQQAQYRPSIRLGNYFEDRCHGLFIYSLRHIRVKAYFEKHPDGVSSRPA
jgi:hypothetical protein